MPVRESRELNSWRQLPAAPRRPRIFPARCFRFLSGTTWSIVAVRWPLDLDQARDDEMPNACAGAVAVGAGITRKGQRIDGASPSGGSSWFAMV